MSKASFFKGAKKAIPIMLGYTPLGLAFGVIAQDKGLNVIQTAFMSFAAFTGSGQFIAVGMLGAGAGVSAILLTNLLINMRYLLFSASMAPFVSKMPTVVQTILAFGITDETFVVNMTEYDNNPPDHHFMLGVNIFAHLSWILNSAIGALVGDMLPDINRFGVNFALPAMFIALLVMQVKNRVVFIAALMSGVLSVGVSLITGNGSHTIIATLLAATMGVVLCRHKQKSTS